MIRRGFTERQAQESFERQPVVDLVFKLWVRMDAEPLLEHQTFKKQQRRIGVGAFAGCADSVMIH